MNKTFAIFRKYIQLTFFKYFWSTKNLHFDLTETYTKLILKLQSKTKLFITQYTWLSDTKKK